MLLAKSRTDDELRGARHGARITDMIKVVMRPDDGVDGAIRHRQTVLLENVGDVLFHVDGPVGLLESVGDGRW